MKVKTILKGTFVAKILTIFFASFYSATRHHLIPIILLDDRCWKL